MSGLIKKAFGSTRPKDIFLDLMTFDRLLTKPVIHIIYWAGLSLIALGIFGVVGGAVGIAIREEAPWGWFLAFPFLIGGALFILAAALLWRSFCEFYVAVFRIADDLRFLRITAEQGVSSAPAPRTETRPEPVAPMVDPAVETVRADDVLEKPFYNPRTLTEQG